MKLLLIIICIALFSCKRKQESGVLYESQTLPMPDYFRKITGYDSIQYVYFMGKNEANFCYPNKWEFEKFKKKDTVFIHDTIRITQYSNKEPKLNVGSARITVKFTPIQTAKK